MTEKVHYIGDFGLYIIPSDAEDYFVYQHRDHIGSIAAQSGENADVEGDIKRMANEPVGRSIERPVGCGKGGRRVPGRWAPPEVLLITSTWTKWD